MYLWFGLHLQVQCNAVWCKHKITTASDTSHILSVSNMICNHNFSEQSDSITTSQPPLRLHLIRNTCHTRSDFNEDESSVALKSRGRKLSSAQTTTLHLRSQGSNNRESERKRVILLYVCHNFLYHHYDN